MVRSKLTHKDHARAAEEWLQDLFPGAGVVHDPLRLSAVDARTLGLLPADEARATLACVRSQAGACPRCLVGLPREGETACDRCGWSADALTRRLLARTEKKSSDAREGTAVGLYLAAATGYVIAAVSLFALFVRTIAG